MVGPLHKAARTTIARTPATKNRVAPNPKRQRDREPPRPRPLPPPPGGERRAAKPAVAKGQMALSRSRRRSARMMPLADRDDVACAIRSDRGSRVIMGARSAHHRHGGSFRQHLLARRSQFVRQDPKPRRHGQAALPCKHSIPWATTKQERTRSAASVATARAQACVYPLRENSFGNFMSGAHVLRKRYNSKETMVIPMKNDRLGRPDF